MGTNIKLESFNEGDSVAIQVIKKVGLDDKLAVIEEINKEIEMAYSAASTLEQNANRS